MPESLAESGMMPAPVAIIIPCYRQAHLLGEALESCAEQQPLPAEIIVVDDGSPDDVSAAVAPYAERLPIRLIRRENGGLSAARNTGLEASQSAYLVFLDADDRLCPGAVAAGLACLRCATPARRRGSRPAPGLAALSAVNCRSQSPGARRRQ